MSTVGAWPEVGANMVPLSGPKGPGACMEVWTRADGLAAKAIVDSTTAASKLSNLPTMTRSFRVRTQQ
jgi:hypothetical protein